MVQASHLYSKTDSKTALYAWQLTPADILWLAIYQ